MVVGRGKAIQAIWEGQLRWTYTQALREATICPADEQGSECRRDWTRKLVEHAITVSHVANLAAWYSAL